VRHIVYHLLASGIRATPAHGEVSLTAERSADTVTILTRDTALHIPPEALANMLDPFPRLENSPARGYEGWEVGLPLVRRYVALHGGELEMESLPQNGTIFRIILPISRSENGRGG
jgi:signal transduction histidine kinase